MNAYRLVGTAGHVDHGKSTLIQALTGTDPDRLQQEKERGITIELGFADFTLPDGTRVGVIDVPGHERFVHHMLAGIGGIDLVLLVVDVQEGVMPQTVEHLQILQLLHIQRGVVVLTKTDLVEDDWLDIVEEEVREALVSTFFAKAPICRVSVANSEGLDGLKKTLIDELSAEIDRQADGPMRLPIDRDFTLTGHGTIITGTLLSGRVKAGDQVELVPSGKSVRVREVHVHGRPATEGLAGQRVALNLAGLTRDEIQRGAVVATPGYYRPTARLDVRLSLLAEAPRPLKTRDPVHLFLGTARTVGRVVLLDRDQLAPGDETYAQIHLELPVVAHRLDRYILRSYSPMTTIGGGRVIDAHPPRHRRFRPEVIERLEALESGVAAEVVQRISEQGAMTLKKLMPLVGQDREQIQTCLQQLQEAGQLIALAEQWVTQADFVAWQKQLPQWVDGAHHEKPLLPGIPRASLKARLPGSLSDKAFNLLLEGLVEAGELHLEGDWVQRPAWQPQPSPRQKDLAEQLLATYRDAGALAKNRTETLQQLRIDDDDVDQVLAYLFYTGQLVRLSDESYLHTDVVDHALQTLVDHFSTQETLTLAEFRDAIGSARKQTQALLEYFDRCSYTQRKGDVRLPWKLPQQPANRG